MARYGAFVARHAKAIVGVWLAGIALALVATLGGFGGGGLFGNLKQAEPYVPGEAHTGNEFLMSGPEAGGTVMVRVDGLDATEQKSVGPKVQRAIGTVSRVKSIASPFSPEAAQAPQAAAPYRSTTSPNSVMFVATLEPGLSKKDQENAAHAINRVSTDAVRGAGTISVGGGVTILERITGQVETDLRTGEGIAMPLTLIVMIFVFGGFVAAGIPLAGAIASIAGGLLALLGFSQLTDLDATVVNIVTILGLGLSIDYGLLIVGRYREELSRLRPERGKDERLTKDEYVEVGAATMASAGRTVLFSGLTVAISVAGLVLFPASVTRAVGLAGLSVVIVACFAALTLVPAFCRVGASRLERKRVVPDRDTGAFATLAHFVQRHVWVSILAVVTVLLVLAAPVLGMRQVSSTAALLPKADSQRVFMESLKRDYPFLAEPAISVVTQANPEQTNAWAANSVKNIEHVSAINPARDLGHGRSVLGIRIDSAGPGNDHAQSVVNHLREHRPSFQTWVTGQQAKLMDYSDAIKSRAPWVVLVVALATIVLLFLMTGSLALPLKALIFNAISLAASLGAITWIFQNGHLTGVLDYSSNQAIESVVPVILLAFGFGLAMDYEVFLLSRIVEAHRAGDDDARAVAVGIQRCGRIVTSAALLMVIVMLGFAAAKMIVVKQMGLGLALSIILDATLVRMILVPATMTLMGRWNWWAPAPLRELHDKLGFEH